jgi:hypothetical protein
MRTIYSKLRGERCYYLQNLHDLNYFVREDSFEERREQRDSGLMGLETMLELIQMPPVNLRAGKSQHYLERMKSSPE